MSWGDITSEIADLFVAEYDLPEVYSEEEGYHDDPAARWLAQYEAQDPEERRAERRSYYRRNRARLKAQALERYHRTKILKGTGKGAGGPAPKLSADAVLTIRAIFRTDPDATPLAVAEHFGVSRETIWAVVTGRTWRGLE